MNTDALTVSNALRTVADLQNRMLHNKTTKEDAAAVLLRCGALMASLADDFSLPNGRISLEEVQTLLEHAEKVNWA